MREVSPAARLGLIMCTRGRNEAATMFLQRLSALSLGTLPARLILVDNNAARELENAAAAVSSEIPVTYVHQPQAGLSHARNAGDAALAADETGVLVDDDIVLPADFLPRVEASLQRETKAGLIGGRVELHDPADLPVTINTRRDRRVVGSGERIFGFIHGCCMIVRPEARRAVGAFDVRLGAGTAAKSGEDTDYLYRVHSAGFPVVYDPEVFVYHAHGRRHVEELAGIRRGWLRGQGAFAFKHALRGDFAALRWLRWMVEEERTRPAGSPGDTSRPGDRFPGASWMVRQRLRGALAYLTGR